MALPNIGGQQTFFQTPLPSGKDIGIKGWKVKHEKELLFSIEQDENSKENKLKHILVLLKNCVDNPKKFDLLSENDLKKLAIEIRKLSKGDDIEYSMNCTAEISKGDEKVTCGAKINDIMYLTKSQKIKPFDLSPSIINDNLIVTFKDLPYTETLNLITKYKLFSQFSYYFLISSISSITFNNVTHTNFTVEEMDECIGELDSNSLNKIESEFQTKSSSVELVRSLTCPKCKNKVNVEFGDLFHFLVL